MTGHPQGGVDLERFRSVPEVLGEFATWDGVLDRLRAGDMPPAKSKTQPSSLERQAMVAWIEALREREARHQAGILACCPHAA